VYTHKGMQSSAPLLWAPFSMCPCLVFKHAGQKQGCMPKMREASCPRHGPKLIHPFVCPSALPALKSNVGLLESVRLARPAEVLLSGQAYYAPQWVSATSWQPDCRQSVRE